MNTNSNFKNLSTDFIIDALRSVAKFNITKREFNNVRQLLLLPDEYLEMILSRNHIQLLFFKHIEDYLESDQVNCITKSKCINRLFRLQQEYQEYQEELTHITLRFSECNISYAILKGMAIGNSLFRKNGLLYRTFSDVDVLIREQDIEKAHNILTKCGYIQGKIIDGKVEEASRRDVLYWRLNSHQLHEYVKLSKYSGGASNRKLAIDVNTTIFEGGAIISPISTSELLKHTYRFDYDGLSIMCLKPTYNLLQLCYHFYKDINYKEKMKNKQNFTLRKFCDIREYIKKYRVSIEWDRLFELAVENRITSQLFCVLSLVSAFYKDLKIDNFLSKFNEPSNPADNKYNWAKMFIE